ncbi:MAG: hypothetical protein HY300_09970 [Verrucomicrobia bacterium]|nr:hypothetical protein [Verrucomicrobiota bacterium]
MQARQPNTPRDPLAEKLRALPELKAPSRIASRVLTAVEAEQLLHTKLRSLPEAPAPASLATTVLAIITQRKQLPWWRQSWFVWPASVRWTTAALAFVLVAACGWFAVELWDGASTAVSSAMNWLTPPEPIRALTATFGHALATFGQSNYALILTALMALAGILYLATLGMATLCYRLAVNRR